MITKEAFDTIEKVSWAIEDKVDIQDIILALMSELGEMAEALRVEDGKFMVRHKMITESSRVETVDGIMILVEFFIRRGGTHEEMNSIAESKMNKWLKLTEDK
jgi:hypothetical protein